MKFRKNILLLVILIGTLYLTGCAEQQTAETSGTERRVFAMNTYMTFTAYGEHTEIALDEVVRLVEKLENLWSVTNENSEIYQANHSHGQTEIISEETSELVSFALKLAEQTGGSLDPTIYPILTAWGFTTENKQVPPTEEITELLQNVDYHRIKLNGRELIVPDKMQLDMGAVAKGYTADLIAQLMREQGIDSAILSLGGNIQAIGSKPDGSDWRIGIRAPWGDGNLGILEISNAAVVTSGGYENYFEDEEGNRYWHILNPTTGYPADSGLLSVTIVGSEGRLCDALSTALFVMGEDNAEEYWRMNSGFDMLLVSDDGEILLTEGIAERFTLEENRAESITVIER